MGLQAQIRTNIQRINITLSDTQSVKVVKRKLPALQFHHQLLTDSLGCPQHLNN